MTTLNDFKALRASVPAEVQKELYSLFSSDPDAARQRMVKLAAEKGVVLTVDQVREFLQQMNEDSEFDDIELDAVALAAVAGGQRGLAGCRSMTNLNDFKQLRASVPAETQTELYSLFSQDPEASFQRMVDIAAEKGMTLTVDEVKGFLKQMDEESEFDDIELDAVALAAVAGGWERQRNC